MRKTDNEVTAPNGLKCFFIHIDKIPGGARLGFITIGDGKTEVLVYMDCLVFPVKDGSGPMFRAIRNEPLNDQSPPVSQGS